MGLQLDVKLLEPEYGQHGAEKLLYAAAEFGPGTKGLLERDDAKFMLQTYIKDDKDFTDPRFAVIRAADHKGLPPATVITCEVDPLRDEGKAYAEKLKVKLMPAFKSLVIGQQCLLSRAGRDIFIAACVHSCVTSMIGISHCCTQLRKATSASGFLGHLMFCLNVNK
jgi:hypothetical protein